MVAALLIAKLNMQYMADDAFQAESAVAVDEVLTDDDASVFHAFELKVLGKHTRTFLKTIETKFQVQITFYS